MDLELATGWHVVPLGGNTNNAFVGTKNNQKVFMKLNASPFLAAISMEGITPKLVWTKRLANGDVFTAQEWVDGQTLSRDEMRQPNVAKVLARVHHSPALRQMLTKIGGRVLAPDQLLQSLKARVADLKIQSIEVARELAMLTRHQPILPVSSFDVCHGDVNRQNWLHDEEHLYLVDWDAATFADPAFDLGHLLGSYVPLDEWSNWLSEYGTVLTTELRGRIAWYAAVNVIANWLDDRAADSQTLTTGAQARLAQLQELIF